MIIGLLFISATIGVHLEETGEIAPEQALALARAATQAFQKDGGRSAELDDPVWASCAANELCVDQIRARLHATDVVLLKVFGGLKRIRVIALRFAQSSKEPARREIDVPAE